MVKQKTFQQNFGIWEIHLASFAQTQCADSKIYRIYIAMLLETDMVSLPPRFSLIRSRQLGMMILTFFRGVKTTNQLHSISAVLFSIILGKVIPQFTELCWVWLNHQQQSFNDGPLLLPGFITRFNSKLTPWYSILYSYNWSWLGLFVVKPTRLLSVQSEPRSSQLVSG